MNDKFKKILERCKCGVYLTINEHRDYYETAQKNLDLQIELNEDFIEDVGKEVINKMVELDTIINLQIYPDTPIGFYSIYHYNLDHVIDTAYNILFKDEQKES